MTRNWRKDLVTTVLVATIAGGITAKGSGHACAGELAVLPGRDADPVVMLGSQLPGLQGLAVDRIVGFRFTGDWQQIPIQIDERRYVDFGVVYHQSPCGFGTMAYADPTTFVGPDTDPAFDGDDELVFMAKDAGQETVWYVGPPKGVVPESAVQVEVRDPLTGNLGYVYLFETDGTLTPGAGVDYVAYRFNLLSGDYIHTYKTAQGPNPEDSYAYTPYYRTHFSDRFAQDGINLFAGGASGVDILDRYRSLKDTGDCGRSEDTFDAGEGAFFTNKDGPVRAIRSYMGCNSGPYLQREYLFYEQRQDITWYWRCHALDFGFMHLWDYSPDATGMRYYDDLNPDGVVVDGQPDTVKTGPIRWEMLTGDQGTLIIAFSIITDIDGFWWTSYYSDDVTPTQRPCTGDPYEYGASGFYRPWGLVNTDPTLGPYRNLTISQTVYCEAPHQTVEKADLRSSQASTPLQVAASSRPMQTAEAAQPYAYWKLDETEGIFVHDSNGPYFGRLQGNPTWQSGAGRFGGALSLDGVDDYVRADFIVGSDRPFSVFCWIKGGGPGQVILSQRDDDQKKLGASWLACDPTTGCLMTALVNMGGRFPRTPLLSQSLITDGVWHHVGLVYDGTHRYLYVDGMEAARDLKSVGVLNGTQGGMNLGAGKNLEPGTFWSGLIDDVRIYDRAVKP